MRMQHWRFWVSIRHLVSSTFILRFAGRFYNFYIRCRSKKGGDEAVFHLSHPVLDYRFHLDDYLRQSDFGLAYVTAQKILMD